jgi:hypothetical protein
LNFFRVWMSFDCIPVDASDLNVARAYQLAQTLVPSPRGALAAAVEIKCRDAELRVGVAGEVRLRQHDETSHAALAGKRVPLRLAHDTQVKLRDRAREDFAQTARVA